MTEKIFGKYRGQVTDNVDPMQLARLQVIVPELTNAPSTMRAMPCLPPGHTGTLPAIGSMVWVEFEGGRPDRPIWSGVFWRDSSEVPATLRSVGSDPMPEETRP